MNLNFYNFGFGYNGGRNNILVLQRNSNKKYDTIHEILLSSIYWLLNIMHIKSRAVWFHNYLDCNYIHTGIYIAYIIRCCCGIHDPNIMFTPWIFFNSNATKIRVLSARSIWFICTSKYNHTWRNELSVLKSAKTSPYQTIAISQK